VGRATDLEVFGEITHAKSFDLRANCKIKRVGASPFIEMRGGEKRPKVRGLKGEAMK
jgi:hypothetical protein